VWRGDGAVVRIRVKPDAGYIPTGADPAKYANPEDGFEGWTEAANLASTPG
jgi:hypothetical protein